MRGRVTYSDEARGNKTARLVKVKCDIDGLDNVRNNGIGESDSFGDSVDHAGEEIRAGIGKRRSTSLGETEMINGVSTRSCLDWVMNQLLTPSSLHFCQTRTNEDLTGQ